ncbi:predicted protein [Sclerotinia sclerotiorum 1980 UF-70]|uniref:Uncharacterized protein n=1 Tax=Sclerotinia sclerotiorum (strain ATCC 18683 / 1980 / Ss-1) TaxID=665079 RepID=A7F1Q6_SCLS1|nr:predicted protein [Sclerotinia sclerotiorum 1980 UF-70]EDN95648.1 predicted protein [Sclerotinia sclerotiorum 1980 UF-70]
MDSLCAEGRIMSGYTIIWSCTVSFLQREGSIYILDRSEGDIGNMHSATEDREITPRLLNCEHTEWESTRWAHSTLRMQANNFNGTSQSTRRGPRQSPIYLLTHCIPLDHTLDSAGDKGACLGLSWPLTTHCPIAEMPHNNDVPAWLLGRVANPFSVKQKNLGKLSALQDE